MKLRTRTILFTILMLAAGLGVSRAMDAGVGATFAPDQPVPAGSDVASTQIKNHLVVVQVMPVGQSNGLKVGDEITEVDGDAVAGRTVKDAIGDINGFYDSTIALTVKRKGEALPLTITVTRHDPHLSAAAAPPH